MTTVSVCLVYLLTCRHASTSLLHIWPRYNHIEESIYLQLIARIYTPFRHRTKTPFAAVATTLIGARTHFAPIATPIALATSITADRPHLTTHPGYHIHTNIRNHFACAAKSTQSHPALPPETVHPASAFAPLNTPCPLEATARCTSAGLPIGLKPTRPSSLLYKNL